MASSYASSHKRYLIAKTELESSMTNARVLRDQWLAAINENPTNLTRKEVENIGKSFKNILLTIKWDCEDLEELISVCSKAKSGKFDKNESLAATCFIADCRNEASKLMEQLEEIESNCRAYNKHGISLPTITTSSLIQSNPKQYERLLDNNNNNNNDNSNNNEDQKAEEEVQFDKSQIVGEPTIFNNALYDHLEYSDQFAPANFNQVFNNPSRPVTNVYMNPNDNEMILDMLETEYYNPPSGLEANNSKINYAVRKMLDLDRQKFLGAVAFLFSFPLLFLLFMML